MLVKKAQSSVHIMKKNGKDLVLVYAALSKVEVIFSEANKALDSSRKTKEELQASLKKAQKS